MHLVSLFLMTNHVSHCFLSAVLKGPKNIAFALKFSYLNYTPSKVAVKTHPVWVCSMSLDHPMVDVDPWQLDSGHCLNQFPEAGAPNDQAEVDNPLHGFHIAVVTY